MTRNNEEELPPAYEETQSQPIRPESPPPSAKRAIAPLTLSETNAAIKGEYVVRLTASKGGPDVKMSSTNGAVSVSLWLQGSLDRPALVEIATTNGRVDLAVRREAGTAIDVHAKSSNGAVVLSLPEDFDGLVTMRSTNGKKRLVGMDELIFPNEGDGKSITYRVRPRAGASPGPSGGGPGWGGDKDKMDKEEQEYKQFQAVHPEHEDPTDKGPDRASAFTSNGSVKVQYIGHKEEEEADGGSTCCIM